MLVLATLHMIEVDDSCTITETASVAQALAYAERSAKYRLPIVPIENDI